LSYGDHNILIDCGPDFKEQALRNHIYHLDGVIFTHAHNDHTAGVDDLKIYCLHARKPLPCLTSIETAEELKQRFYYIFDQEQKYEGLTVRFNLQLLTSERGEIVFQNLRLRHFAYEQMGMRVDGFRAGSIAYVSDIRNYPETIFEDLEGVDTLVLSALRFAPSKMHFHIDEAIDFANRVGAKETWLTHIAHELDHEKANAYLPENIRMGYDGLRLTFHADAVEDIQYEET
jgi:phosphoribosyl 1,2-cyclic phosphate phosphodiesterase